MKIITFLSFLVLCSGVAYSTKGKFPSVGPIFQNGGKLIGFFGGPAKGKFPSGKPLIQADGIMAGFAGFLPDTSTFHPDRPIATTWAELKLSEGMQEARELLGRELQRVSSAKPADFATQLKTFVRDCVDCVASKLGFTSINAEDNYIAAAIGASLEETKQMLDGVDVYYQANVAALIKAAARGRWQEMRLLLQAGADVNVHDSEGNTALHTLLRHDNTDVEEAVALLLAYGADVAIKNNSGELPLMLAIENQHSKVTKALLTSGWYWRGSYYDSADTE